MSRNNLIAYCSLLLVIIILLAVIIFRKSQVTSVSGQEKVLLDSISLLQNNVIKSKVRQAKLEKDYDSLSSLEPSVIYRTHEKIQYILITSDPDKLTDIIRSNYKTKF